MNELVKILPKSGELTRTGWNLPATITKDEWFEIGNSFNQVGTAVQWAWGDWWNSGNFEHGERKALVESDEWNGLGYETLKKYGAVCERFQKGSRLPLLTFSHHHECISLPIEEAVKVLDWAVENKASKITTRAKVKEIKSWLAQGWTTDQLERKAMVEAGYAVVASKKTGEDGKIVDAALIAWADQQEKMVEIGRNTEWGNPFVMGKDGDRDEVCNNYELHYVPFKPSILDNVNKLRGNVLVCWCYPERCHGDHLKTIANEA